MQILDEVIKKISPYVRLDRTHLSSEKLRVKLTPRKKRKISKQRKIGPDPTLVVQLINGNGNFTVNLDT